VADLSRQVLAIWGQTCASLGWRLQMFLRCSLLFFVLSNLLHGGYGVVGLALLRILSILVAESSRLLISRFVLLRMVEKRRTGVDRVCARCCSSSSMAVRCNGNDSLAYSIFLSSFSFPAVCSCGIRAWLLSRRRVRRHVASCSPSTRNPRPQSRAILPGSSTFPPLSSFQFS
jgi:hypothetical protein